METLRAAVKQAISDVLETMFFQPMRFADETRPLKEWFFQEGTLLGASLDFDGPPQGSFFLLVPDTLIGEWTANLLGMDRREIGDEQKRDTLKEAINMIGGRALSLLDAQGVCRMGIPQAMENKDLPHSNLEELQGETFLIDTGYSHSAAGIVLAKDGDGKNGKKDQGTHRR